MLTLARDSAHVYVGYSFQVNNDDNVLLDVFSHGGQYQRDQLTTQEIIQCTSLCANTGGLFILLKQ